MRPYTGSLGPVHPIRFFPELLSLETSSESSPEPPPVAPEAVALELAEELLAEESAPAVSPPFAVFSSEEEAASPLAPVSPPAPALPPAPAAGMQLMSHVEIMVPRACRRCVRRLQKEPDHICVRVPGRMACNHCCSVKHACEPVGAITQYFRGFANENPKIPERAYGSVAAALELQYDCLKALEEGVRPPSWVLNRLDELVAEAVRDLREPRARRH